MYDFRIGFLAVVLSVPCIAIPSGSLVAKDVSTDAAKHWQDIGWPLLQKFCLDCHNETDPEAGLDLSDFGSIEGMGGGGSMQRVLEMVRFGAMPPEDSDLPSEDERKSLVKSLDRTLFAVSCDLRPRPGKVTARRLNKAEYNNAIRDLFSMDLKPADAFPSDEVGAGFDNNGDILSMSPMLMEKYISAAELVSSQVVIDPRSLPRIDLHVPSDQLHTHGDFAVGRFNGLFMLPDSVAWMSFETLRAGEHQVTLQCGAAGDSENEAKRVKLAVYDDRGVLVANPEVKYYGDSGRSQTARFRLKFDVGKHRLLVAFDDGSKKIEVGKTHRSEFDSLDRKWVSEATKRASEVLRPDKRFNRSDYPWMLRKISVYGPTGIAKDELPPSQYIVLRKSAKLKGEKWSGVKEAAMESLRPLMTRAFREPVSDVEVEPYADLVCEATERGESYYRGLQIGVSAILVSPRFLFRVETPTDAILASLKDNQPVELTPHQLATRMSFFLWSSIPDEHLQYAAEHNKLDFDRLPSQVRRMLADKRSEALAEQFADQWLGLRNLQRHEADTDKFKTFTDSLRDSMIRETQLLFMYLVRENRPASELLSADYSFLNEEMANHYGIDGVEGNAFRRVELKRSPRRGVLSHASVLTLTSNPGRTSPVKRGKWILENILGTPPPDPPPGVPELEQSKTADADASLRKQMEIHREDPSCAACHRVMDQLGFGLESFDAIGRYRTRDGKFQVDASGELPGGRRFNGAQELSDVLEKTEADAFARTVIERLMTFALGRQMTPTDRCTIEDIAKRTEKTNYRLSDLIVEVVQSQPFRFYDWAQSSSE